VRVQLSVARDRGGRGAVAIMVAILSTVLLGIAAFTTDFGMAYAQRQALYTGTDSAALAIVHSEYKSVMANPRSCNDIKTDDQAQATNIAVQQINRNSPFGQSIPAGDITANLDCVGTNHGVLQATVSVDHQINTLFGRVAGVSSMDVNRTSAAALGTENKVTGIRPIGICKYQADQLRNSTPNSAGIYPAQLIALTKVWNGNSSCSGDGAGNWGWLDLGQGNGDSALGAMISQGFDGVLTLSGNPPAFMINGNPMTGSPGNKGNGQNVHDGMQAIMDYVVWLPVYDTYSQNGQNATYHIIAFISVRICGYDVTIKGACYDPAVPMQGNDMQVRYVGWTTPGDLDPSGQLDKPNAFNAYTTKLVR
jgi:Flp pilus assembly protein TadG